MGCVLARAPTPRAPPLLAPAASRIALDDGVRHPIAKVARHHEHRLRIRVHAREREHIATLDRLFGALGTIVIAQNETIVATAAIALGDKQRSLLEWARFLINAPHE